MLHFIRKQTKTFAWFFVIILILVFAMTSFTLNKEGQYAGEVFGKKISFQEFRIFESIARLLPPNQQIAEDAQIQYQFVWQQMILSHEAKNKGIQVSDIEVRTRIDQMVNPDESKRLSQDEYLQLLKSRRTTPNEFENGVRELIRIQKLMTSHFESVFSAPTPPAPVMVPTQAGNDEATKPTQETADKIAADSKARQEEYVQWMTDILQRSKVVDYSQINSPSAPAAQPAQSNSPSAPAAQPAQSNSPA